MPASDLLRLAGLATVVASVLYIVAGLAELANLMSQLFFGEAIVALLYIGSLFMLLGQVLLVLGLVGLYVHQSEDAGVLGLIGFLLALLGLVWTTDNIWAALLVYLGWVLFGASSLRAGVYPRSAAVLLLSSALLGGAVVAAFIASGPSTVLVLIGLCVEIIFYVAIGWLGYSLWREVHKPDKPSPGSEDGSTGAYS